MDSLDTKTETLIKTHISPDNKSISPTITLIGISSESSPYQQICDSVTTLAKKIYPVLADYGLNHSGGTGWEKIGHDPDFGIMKLPFGKDMVRINQDDLIESKALNNIVFTAKQMCDVATFTASKELLNEFPDLEIEWLTLQTNMMETQKGPLVPHHVLVIKTKDSDLKYFLDMTYGQIKYGQGVLLAPLKTIDKYYPEAIIETPLKIDQAWKNYEDRAMSDNNLQVITNKLKSIHNS